MADGPVVEYASPTNAAPRHWPWVRLAAIVVTLCIFLYCAYDYAHMSWVAADWKALGAEAQTGIAPEPWVIESRARGLAIVSTVATAWIIYGFLAWRRRRNVSLSESY